MPIRTKINSDYQDYIDKALAKNNSFSKDLDRFLNDKHQPMKATFASAFTTKGTTTKYDNPYFSSKKPTGKVKKACEKCGKEFSWNYTISRIAFDARKICMSCQRGPAKKPCEYCKKMIEKRDNQSWWKYRQKRFCNNTCHNHFKAIKFTQPV